MCFSSLQHVREIALRPPLVNTSVSSDDDDSNGNLHALMKGVCELVTFYEHVSRTESGSLLHTLLTANMNDSCQWVSQNAMSLIYIDGFHFHLTAEQLSVEPSGRDRQ